jgi:hypothetical protein
MGRGGGYPKYLKRMVLSVPLFRFVSSLLHMSVAGLLILGCQCVNAEEDGNIGLKKKANTKLLHMYGKIPWLLSVVILQYLVSLLFVDRIWCSRPSVTLLVTYYTYLLLVDCDAEGLTASSTVLIWRAQQ